MRQKKKVFLGVLAVTGFTLAGATTAFLTDFSQKVNLMAVGHNTTVIEEDFPKTDPKPIPENPEYRKKVWVTNRTGAETGFNVDCYVRVSLSYSNSDIGNAIVLRNLNTTDWEYHQDGYYYYKKILKEGQSTAPLFDGFSIRSDLVDDASRVYISDFCISVYEESVQADGFANYAAAWSAMLNPAGKG